MISWWLIVISSCSFVRCSFFRYYCRYYCYYCYYYALPLILISDESHVHHQQRLMGDQKIQQQGTKKTRTIIVARSISVRSFAWSWTSSSYHHSSRKSFRVCTSLTHSFCSSSSSPSSSSSTALSISTEVFKLSNKFFLSSGANLWPQNEEQF